MIEDVLYTEDARPIIGIRLVRWVGIRQVDPSSTGMLTGFNILQAASDLAEQGENALVVNTGYLVSHIAWGTLAKGDKSIIISLVPNG